MAVGVDKLIQSNLYGHLSQCLTLHNPAPCRGKETFTFPLELMKYDLSHNGIQDGIAQELQPFVVDGSSPVALGRHGSMHQGLLIVLYVVRIESQNVIKRAIKPFFLSER